MCTPGRTCEQGSMGLQHAGDMSYSDRPLTRAPHRDHFQRQSSKMLLQLQPASLPPLIHRHFDPLTRSVLSQPSVHMFYHLIMMLWCRLLLALSGKVQSPSCMATEGHANFILLPPPAFLLVPNKFSMKAWTPFVALPIPVEWRSGNGSAPHTSSPLTAIYSLQLNLLQAAVFRMAQHVRAPCKYECARSSSVAVQSPLAAWPSVCSAGDHASGLPIPNMMRSQRPPACLGMRIPALSSMKVLTGPLAPGRTAGVGTQLGTKWLVDGGLASWCMPLSLC